MPTSAMISAESTQDEDLSRLQAELRGIIVGIALRMGYPRSLGEIYGLLYVTEEPMSMDQIMSELGMSLGSASQGLKTLRSLKAVKTNQHAGIRKDFYTAETNFRHLVSGFLREEILPELDETRAKIGHLEALEKSLNAKLSNFYTPRVAQVRNLNNAARRLLPIINQFLKN